MDIATLCNSGLHAANEVPRMAHVSYPIRRRMAHSFKGHTMDGHNTNNLSTQTTDRPPLDGAQPVREGHIWCGGIRYNTESNYCATKTELKVEISCVQVYYLYGHLTRLCKDINRGPVYRLHTCWHWGCTQHAYDGNASCTHAAVCFSVSLYTVR